MNFEIAMIKVKNKIIKELELKDVNCFLYVDKYGLQTNKLQTNKEFEQLLLDNEKYEILNYIKKNK